MKNYKKISKKWIDPNSTGFIFSRVEKQDGRSWAELKLGDCSRIVSFDVYVDSELDRKATLKKVDLIIKEMSLFRDRVAAL